MISVTVDKTFSFTVAYISQMWWTKGPGRQQRALWGWNEIMKDLFSTRSGQGVHHWEEKGAWLSIFLNHTWELQLDLTWSMGFICTYHSKKKKRSTTSLPTCLVFKYCIPCTTSTPKPRSTFSKPRRREIQHSQTEFTPCSRDLNNTSTIS